MWPRNLSIAGALAALVFDASGAAAGMVGLEKPSLIDGRIVQKVHSVDAAEHTLHRRGYYDIRLERPTLPYSFNACKRGVRYHIHMNYYGDLTQVDAIGRCHGNGYGYYARRSYDDYYGRRPYYERYRYRDRY